ncbi:hypothetical protein NDU88_006288 [Pleurodeles waltl]|uniref:Putative nuclease HARBI1 n=1 Tax=Pleurodeles waltl TaxID=8319 RepID=A0AAV7TF63_PLEWA|nr:hypothetical protein NDU88_006288 [Pleurodeles waltl]
MAVTPAAVRTAAVRTATAGAHRHWLLRPIGFNVNQCCFTPRSSTAYRHGVPRQRIDLTSHCHTSQVEDLPTVKGDFYALGHIPNIIGAIDGTHVALVPPSRSEQVYRNRKSYHSMNVQMVCLADQYISHVNAKFPGSVHDAYIMRNSSIPYVMGQLQRHRVWLIGDSGYPNLSWLLTPVRNPRTRAEERYNEAHGRNRMVIERTFGLLKARFRCLHMTGGSLLYSPKKVCQIIVACCMIHNLALRRQVPFLQKDGPDGGVVAAVDDIDNRNTVIQQYFQ